MPSTSIPAVKAAIMAALQAAQATESELADVYVTDDREPESADEYVWLYKASAERDWKLLRGGAGRLPMKEQVSAELRVFVALGSDEAKPSEERAFAIAELVEGALRDDVTLNDTLLHQLVSKLDQDQLVFDNLRRGCHVLMTVTGEARIPGGA